MGVDGHGQPLLHDESTAAQSDDPHSDKKVGVEAARRIWPLCLQRRRRARDTRLHVAGGFVYDLSIFGQADWGEFIQSALDSHFSFAARSYSAVESTGKF